MLSKLVVALTLIKVAATSGQLENAEWAGVFETPLTLYTWTAQKTGEDVSLAYVDPTMKLAVVPVVSATDEALRGVEDQADALLGQRCTDVGSGGTIAARSDVCYRLIFDENMWQSLYTVNTSGTTAVAFFAEHYPTEFEKDAHYLKDHNAVDIEPLAELPPAPAPAPKEDDTPWGEAIGASIIVNIVTLVGVILAVPAISKVFSTYVLQATAIMCGFAGGAILACAFFLLLFEATHLVNAGWDEEVDVLWRWGTMILAGIIFPSVVHSVSDLIPQHNSTTSSTDPGAAQANSELKKPDLYLSERLRLIVGVHVGDFFHNLCDGIFLGFGFKGCGPKFGWQVLVGTVLHEFPQELADYVILTGPNVGFSPLVALVSNFVAGLGVVLGAILVLSQDVNDEVTGLFLAFGGGVYIHIGAVECMPKIYDSRLSPLVRIICISAFILGTILIGLVLLDHEHCVPSTPGVPNTGHHH